MCKKEGLGKQSLPQPLEDEMEQSHYIIFPNRTKAAERLARMLVRGGRSKKTVALAGRYRLWAQTTETEIRVGFHGKGQPLMVVRRGEQ